MTNMSIEIKLIKCPTCKAHVSNHATYCPKCGYPIAANSNPQPLQLEEKPVLDLSETNSQIERRGIPI